MSISNFFKKSPKKETSGKPAKDNHLGSPEQQKKRYEAALEYLELIQEKTPLLNGRPHAGTVMSIPARLAGTSLFRAINKKDFAPDVVVLSDEVNEAYPQLLNLFAFYCKQNEIDVMEKPVVTEFPEGDNPLMEIAQVQENYQVEYNEIMKKHGLDYLEGARAGMIICSMVFNYHCIKNKDIDPYVATGIVAMGVVEGAKTSPVALDAGKIKTESKKPSQQGVSRFVIGELGAVLQDVKENGGQYTQLNPAVEAKLKEGNIDPKIVYIKGLESQLEAKVSRVDFVQMNIDEVLRQDENDQMPIHVLLAFWLNDKAEEYGYKREGNSWILKK